MAVLQEQRFLLEFLSQLIQLIAVLVLRSAGLAAFVHHNDETDNIELLLVDTVLVEQSEFV